MSGVQIPTLYLGMKPNKQLDSAGRPVVVSLTLKIFGGFSWEFSSKLGRYTWRSKPPVYEETNDADQWRYYRQLRPLEWLKDQNEAEYDNVIEWRQELREELDRHKDVPRIAGRIKRQLDKANLMLQAFVDWFLDNRLEVPNIDLGDDEPAKTSTVEKGIAPSLKYTEDDFKEFNEFVTNKKQLPAAKEFCKDHGFRSPQGFLRQFRDRYLNQKRKMKG